MIGSVDRVQERVVLEGGVSGMIGCSRGWVEIGLIEGGLVTSIDSLCC